MSAPRRATGDSILATLERAATAKASPGAAPRPRLAWLVAGGALVLILIACIAWLAHVNATTVRVLPVEGAKAKPRDPHGDTVVAATRMPDTPAVIIDEPAEPAQATQVPPPLVMLEAAPKPVPAPARKTVPASLASPPSRSWSAPQRRDRRLSSLPRRAPLPPTRDTPRPCSPHARRRRVPSPWRARRAQSRQQYRSRKASTPTSSC